MKRLFFRVLLPGFALFGCAVFLASVVTHCKQDYILIRDTSPSTNDPAIIRTDAEISWPTYTVTVDGGLWKHTNVVEVIENHENSTPPCTLIRYVEKGFTNEFHAWAVLVIMETNK